MLPEVNERQAPSTERDERPNPKPTEQQTLPTAVTVRANDDQLARNPRRSRRSGFRRTKKNIACHGYFVAPQMPSSRSQVLLGFRGVFTCRFLHFGRIREIAAINVVAIGTAISTTLMILISSPSLNERFFRALIAASLSFEPSVARSISYRPPKR